MRSLRQALDAGRAHQPPAWSRYAVLCGPLVLLCGLLMVNRETLDFVERGWSPDYRAPNAVAGPPLPEKAAFVSINRYGVARISSGEETALPVASDEELLTAVRHIVAEHPGRPFVLRIDRDTPYAKVQSLLAVLREGGAETVFFHTELPSP